MTGDALPPLRYTKTSDGVYIAYHVVGDGPIDIVYEPGWVSNIDLNWERDDIGPYLRRLASWARLIVFDRRGSGLSDRTAGIPSLETRVDDLRAVMDASGSERALLIGMWDGGDTAALFASMFPERVIGLVMIDTQARTLWAPDYPWGDDDEGLKEFDQQVDAGWGRGPFEEWWQRGRSTASEPEYIRELARYFRHSISPGGAILANAMWGRIDIRDILPAIHVPTLLFDGGGDRAETTWLAEHIAGARIEFTGSPGINSKYLPSPGGIWEADRIRAFVDEIRDEEAVLDRVLATVLFTDIVGSTDRAAATGDRAWSDVIKRHHQVVRAMLARYRGVEVDTAGDGFFATFDGPARAARCALAIADSVRPLGLEVRAGVHAGEVEVVDRKVAGMTVHIGARIAATAQPSQVLASSTVRDLCLGSGLHFEDTGEQELKGVPDRWRLYRVAG